MGPERPTFNSLRIAFDSGNFALFPDMLCMKRIYRDTCRVQNADIPRAGRVEAHGRMARRGRAGLDANNYSPGRQASLAPFKESKTRRLNVFPEARTSEILCKWIEEQNPRLTRGSSAVYPRFISGTRSALSSWLLASGPTPFVSINSFLTQGMFGKIGIGTLVSSPERRALAVPLFNRG